MVKKVDKYYVIVIDTGEEIEMTEKGFTMMCEAIVSGEMKQQVLFRNIKGKMYMEQRHNIRMREASEVIY